ncbi:MAG: pilus assembly protein FimV [Paraglaciecola sp.]
MSVAIWRDVNHNEGLYFGARRNHMNLRKIAVQLLIVLSFVTAIPAAKSQQGNLRGPKNSNPKYSEPQPQPQNQRQDLPQAQRGTQSDIYGPIVSSDTLWQISQRYLPNSSQSIYQVMQAIYELNPDAFEQQNINLLRDGSILRMPSETYISGINIKQAQAKAELDSQKLQSNTLGQATQQASNTAALEQTRQLIEQKLGAIDEAQNRQFMAIRKQFSESINSVQSILDENKKLFERLNKVNTDIDEMRSEEQEKSLQMNQMGESIEELLEKSRKDDALKAARIAEKDTSWLNNPIALILLFTLPVLLVLTAFAYWMIKRKAPEVVKLEEDDVDDFSLDPLTAEMDNLSDALSAQLSGEGDDELDDDNLFGDDDLLDDVLSEELEESLDDALEDSIENSLADNTENFDDLGDDALDDLLEEEFEVGAEVVEQDELDSLFDEDDDLLAEVQDSDDNSDFDNMIIEEDEQQVEPEVDDLEYEEDESLLASVEADVDTKTKSVLDDEEQPEISIDDLLNESEDESVENPLIDDSDVINEEVLQNLDNEIVSQNEELDSVTGSLIDELEQVEQMRSMLPDDDEEDDELFGVEEPQLGIQKLDDLAEKIDEDDFDTDEIDDEIEVDISEVLNEAQQPVASEESAEPEQVVDAEELAEPDLAVESEELAEPEQSVEAEELAEPEQVIESEELAEPDQAVESEELAEPEQSVEAEELAEPEQVIESEELAEPGQAAEAEELSESEQSVEAVELAEPEQAFESEELAEPEQVVEDDELTEDRLDEDDNFDTELSADFDMPANSDSTLDEDQLEKALEDFEKEELDEVLGDLTSNDPSSVSSLDDLAFSADDFVTKNQPSGPSPSPTLNEGESVDDFDDSELDNAFDENIDGLSLEPSQNHNDELDDLPGLGDWLDDDDFKQSQKQTNADEDDGIIEELEGSSFDEMLESIDLDDDLSEEDDTGFDIAALLDEKPESKDIDDNEQETEDFLDVEALLNESFSAESDDEIDKALDLDIPLEPFVNERDNFEMIDVDADDGLGAKLDLAHAYIEIGEDDSAKELLDQILQKGTAEQIAEVKKILNKLD